MLGIVEGHASAVRRHGSERIERVRWAGCRLASAFVALLLCVNGCGTVAAEATPHPGIISRIEREPVDSRALAAIGYSKRLRALEIEFRRGGTYRYLGVPPSLHQELLAAKSKARFYNENVRGKYRSLFVRPRRKK